MGSLKLCKHRQAGSCLAALRTLWAPHSWGARRARSSFSLPQIDARHLKAPPLCHALAGARGNKAVKAVDCGSIPAQMAALRLTLGCLPLSPGECGLCLKSVRPHPNSIVLETRPVVPNSKCLLTTCREIGNLIRRLLLVSGGCLRLGLGSDCAQ